MQHSHDHVPLPGSHSIRRHAPRDPSRTSYRPLLRLSPLRELIRTAFSLFIYNIYLFPKTRSTLQTPRLAHSSDPASQNRPGQPVTKDRRPSSRLRARMLQLRPWLWYLRGTLSSIRVTPMTDPNNIERLFWTRCRSRFLKRNQP